MDSCPSCCLSCSTHPPPSKSAYSNPAYNFSQFLSAGTVQLALAPNSSQCSHVHCKDGWHSFLEVTGVQPNFESLFDSIQFLARHHFIATTYRHHLPDSPGPGSHYLIIIRIYLIPFDLPGVNGRLTYFTRKNANAQVLRVARHHMADLLGQISQDQQSWTFGHPRSCATSKIIETSTDTRTLSEIYNNLPSPNPNSNDSPLKARLLNFGDSLDGLGLQSTLLKYQRESVAAMLEREEAERLDTPHPLYVTLKGLDGKTFFFQPGTAEILRERSVVSIPPGGILCEELGTGKTIMVLALILGTLKELSKPEESVIDPRPILTPLSFRHFPSGEFSAIRERLPRGQKVKLFASDVEFGVPSFRELLLHRLCSSPDSTIPDRTTATGTAIDNQRQFVSEKFDLLPMYNRWKKANTPFYFHFPDSENLSANLSIRGRREPVPRTLYLSAATLIVVPPNLLSQWEQEIHKHCEVDPRFLIVRSKDALPIAKDLATDYDIILMTYARFCDEDQKANIQKDAYSEWKVCNCVEFVDFRIPNCKCKEPDLSPLLQIRWKRLVIDEGHVSSSTSTRLTPFAKLISVQARWVVTGTPTTNLLGLNFGVSTNGDEEMPSGTIDSNEQDSSPPSAPGDDPSLPSEVDLFPARIWNKSDNRDITKLMNIMTQFIGIKFLADAQTIRTQIKDALFTDKGSRPGAIEMLVNLMKTVMIRHRIGDVEEEITLPKLTHESVLLDLHPLAVISYNALQAGIVVNAIDSERTDQDYLFHPSNSEYLQTLVQNISQLMFWFVDLNLYNVEEAYGNVEKMLLRVKNKEKNISESDHVLAKKAYAHICFARDHNLWREIQKHEDIPCDTANIPASIFKAWSGIEGSGLMHLDRLLQLQENVLRKPLYTEDQLCSLGSEVSKAELLTRQLYNEFEQRKGSMSKKSTFGSGKQITAGSSDFKTRTATKSASSADKIKEMQRELQESLARLAVESNVFTTPGPETLKIRLGPSRLLPQSPLARTRVLKTMSAKLNYIIEEVKKFSSREKFLIFSESPLTLAYIYEALNLLQIKSLQFTTQITQLVREQYVLTFETSDLYRVFLMELKHGARGLNLVSASRVIFCEPVWQADVESQAIKRAHRIGQLRPVCVKTLVIRGTAEEKMLSRRKELEKNGGKAPKLLEETGMRYYIEHPEFIECKDFSGAAINDAAFPLFHLPTTSPTPLQPSTLRSSLHKRVRVEEPLPHSSSNMELSPPKRAVRFA